MNSGIIDNDLFDEIVNDNSGKTGPPGEAANNRYRKRDHAGFFIRAESDRVADYGLASGIFNLRRQRGDTDWRSYMRACLNVPNDTSQPVFAFHCLVSCWLNKTKDYLSCARHCYCFDWCIRQFLNNISLPRNYNLYGSKFSVRRQA